MKWTKVEDALPENDETVLVYAYWPYEIGNINPISAREYEMRFATYSTKTQRWNVFDYGDYDYKIPDCVTHWMPLPEPPKNETED
jgi:hypothetical protein